MGGEIVHDDDVSRRECRAKKFHDVFQEEFAIDGAVGYHGSGHILQAQCRDDGGGFPVAVRHIRHQPFGFGRTPVTPCHIRGSPCLVDEYQPCGVKRGLIFFPFGARFLHVFALLLAGVQGFF